MDPVTEMASSEINTLTGRVSQRFGEFLSGRDDPGWQHPVPACPPWTVRDLTAHTSWVAELYGGCVRKGLEGSSEPPWEDLGAARREAQAARRPLDNAALLADFRASIGLMNRTLAGIAPAEYATPAWHPRGIQTVGRFQVAWLWELGIHHHDLRSAFDPAAGFEPDVAPTFVEYLVRALPRYLGPESDPELVATYRFALSNPARSVTVRLADGTFDIAPDGAGDADVTFNTDGTTWVLSVLNRIDPAAATADGRIRVAGDSSLAERFWKQLRKV